MAASMSTVSAGNYHSQRFESNFLPGTENLKCVDLSICPVSETDIMNYGSKCILTPSLQDNLGTNTYSSALLVGEKGADLLCEDLGKRSKSNASCVAGVDIVCRHQSEDSSCTSPTRSSAARCSRNAASSLNGLTTRR